MVEWVLEDIGKVFFGVWVEVEDDDGKVECFWLVGFDEVDGSCGEISIDVLLVWVLFGKWVDDEVWV